MSVLSNDTTLILDGGMGQELRHRSSKPASPLWSSQVMLDEPELVTAVHREFIAAGAQVITVNTYAATPERLARDGAVEWFEALHGAALDAAHRARDDSGRDDIIIAGCLPPLVASYHSEVAPDDPACLASYRRIVEAQAGRVDLFLAETLSLAREAKAAAEAATESGLPVWVALTVADDDGTQLRSGERLIDVGQQAKAAGAKAVLVNCSAPEAITASMSVLGDLGLPFGGYGNGFQSVMELVPGGTVEGLSRREELTPEAYARYAADWVDRGARIVGGCCEIGPQHIKVLSEWMTKN